MRFRALLRLLREVLLGGGAGGNEVFVPRDGDKEGVVSGVQAIGNWCWFGGEGREKNGATDGAPGGNHRRGIGFEAPDSAWMALPGTSVILLYVCWGHGRGDQRRGLVPRISSEWFERVKVFGFTLVRYVR